jgi:hypothetical protein
MPNGGNVSADQFQKWEQAFAAYKDTIEEFAREKGIRITKWYHDFPCWLMGIGRDQALKDLNIIWRNIEILYKEDNETFILNATAWVDKEYQTPQGKVRERRLTPPEKSFVTRWKAETKIEIQKLLEAAYQRVVSFTEQDLTQTSASIEGPDGVWRKYK